MANREALNRSTEPTFHQFQMKSSLTLCTSVTCPSSYRHFQRARVVYRVGLAIRFVDGSSRSECLWMMSEYKFDKACTRGFGTCLEGPWPLPWLNLPFSHHKDVPVTMPNIVQFLQGHPMPQHDGRIEVEFCFICCSLSLSFAILSQVGAHF